MNTCLLIIFLSLLILVLGKNGIPLFLTILINFSLVLSGFILIVLGLNPFLTCFLLCSLLAWINIYRVTENDIKRHSSLLSVMIVLGGVSIFIFLFTYLSKTYGFGYEAFEEINMFSYNVSISFLSIEIGVILLGLLGALVDASISISSALYEIYINNKKLKQKELFSSGLNIGKDILVTTINTLLFAFFGESITLLVLLYGLNLSPLELINNKTFLEEIFKILFSMLGSLLVIPLTSYISANYLTKKIKTE